MGDSQFSSFFLFCFVRNIKVYLIVIIIKQKENETGRIGSNTKKVEDKRGLLV